MGNGMNKVLPGLYVGNYRDSKDHQQLEKFQITHIIAIHDSPRRLLPDKHYLCVMAADTPDQNLSQYFSVCNDFIHAARLREGNVLIHCLAGMSRSVTVAIAYIMTATNLNWKEALKVVRAGRAVANPNIGFQTQLQEFEMYRLGEERRRLRERFPSSALEQLDRSKCMAALDNYDELLQNKDICEGNCSRGEKCPTGVCNMDPAKGLFRRRPSSSSTRSRLRMQPSTSSSSGSMANIGPSGPAVGMPAAGMPAAGITTATAGIQSCPASPSHSPLARRSANERKIPEDEEEHHNPTTSTEAAAYAAAKREQKQPLSSKKSPTRRRSTRDPRLATMTESMPTDPGPIPVNSPVNPSLPNNGNGGALLLQRSASTVSGLVVRPRSSPAGLHTYTGSVPASIHGSRVDLRDNDKGSAIYLGCSAPRTSTLSLSSRGSSGGSTPSSPARTPPVSPRHGLRRTTSNAKKPR